MLAVPRANTSSNTRPICATCNVPMWLMEIGYSSEHERHQIFQCKVCDTKLVVPFVVAPTSNYIEQQNCSQCGNATLLFGVEPERPGHELLTFVCPKCQHIETAVWKIP